MRATINLHVRPGDDLEVSDLRDDAGKLLCQAVRIGDPGDASILIETAELIRLRDAISAYLAEPQAEAA